MRAMELISRELAFGQYLVDRALLSGTLLQQAQEVSSETHSSLVRSLAKLGFMPEGRLADALAEFEDLPRHMGPVRLADALEPLSIEFLQFHGVAPLKVGDTEITVATANPLDETGVRGIEFVTELKVKGVVATLGEVDGAFVNVTELAAEMETRAAVDSGGSIEA